MKPVRPIHLPGATALESLRERTAAALGSWAREWVSGAQAEGLSGLMLRVVPAASIAHSPTEEYETLRAERGPMWFRRSHTDREQLGRAVVGVESMSAIESADPWITVVIDQARDNRDRALCSALMGALAVDVDTSVGAIPREVFAFGSGAVELSCESLGLHAIADGAVWRGIPPTERSRQHPRPKSTPLNAAVRSAKARLEVILGSVEVELPKVLDLRCGDVLRLPQRLDRAIAVSCEGKPLARVALGERQGHKSVQLLSDPL